MQSGDAFSSLLVADTLTKIGQGAAIGAGLQIGISSYLAYRRYKAGEISIEEAYKFIGKEACKGAVVGGSLAGLSLVVPGGIIGLGVGILVGTSLKRILDVGFGDGSYRTILNTQGSVVIAVKSVVSAGAVLAQVAAEEQLVLRRVRRHIEQAKRFDRALDHGLDVLDRKRENL
jgi:hypothetical protein